MSILVAIPIHDRPRLVAHCLATAVELRLPPGSEIVVVDDASTDPAIAALLDSYAARVRLLRNEHGIGADAMIHTFWQRFMASPHRALLFLDSDMIANRTAVEAGLSALEGFEGLLSLYNSTLHPDSGPRTGELLPKPHLGNAGTLWTRRLVDLALAEVPSGPQIDVRYSERFARRGIAMAAMARSRVQHLGIEGTNNRYFGTIDYGIGFVPDAEAQSRALVETLDVLLGNQPYYLPPPPGPLRWALRKLRRLFR